MNCPCGLTEKYENCCGTFHTGKAQPETPERLMRARYSAFAKGAVDYIFDTTLPEERTDLKMEDIAEWSKSSEWVGLEILGSSVDKSGNEGHVEFKANYKNSGSSVVHHEYSKFKKVDGKWFFVDGRIIPGTLKRIAPKIGRNDPCACGSGAKFKKCCGKAA